MVMAEKRGAFPRVEPPASAEATAGTEVSAAEVSVERVAVEVSAEDMVAAATDRRRLRCDKPSSAN
jgi:hypothetical protein